MNWTFCWLPLLQLLRPPVGVVGDAEAVEPVLCLTTGVAGAHAVERGEVDELVEDPIRG